MGMCVGGGGVEMGEGKGEREGKGGKEFLIF